jgi:hypothetical protein
MQKTYKKLPTNVQNVTVKELNENITQQISHLKELIRLSQERQNRMAYFLKNL